MDPNNQPDPNNNNNQPFPQDTGNQSPPPFLPTDQPTPAPVPTWPSPTDPITPPADNTFPAPQPVVDQPVPAAPADPMPTFTPGEPAPAPSTTGSTDNQGWNNQPNPADSQPAAWPAAPAPQADSIPADPTSQPDPVSQTDPMTTAPTTPSIDQAMAAPLDPSAPLANSGPGDNSNQPAMDINSPGQPDLGIGGNVAFPQEPVSPAPSTFPAADQSTPVAAPAWPQPTATPTDNLATMAPAMPDSTAAPADPSFGGSMPQIDPAPASIPGMSDASLNAPLSTPEVPAAAPAVPGGESSWMGAPGPTDLSHVADSPTADSSAPAAPQTENLVVPATPQVNPVSEGSSGFPKWLIAVGALILLVAIGASAYFILGLGKTESSNTPVVQSNTESKPLIPVETTTVPSPVVSPAVTESTNSATNSLPSATTSGQVRTSTSSAIDLLRRGK
jgi:hypothetical protein